MPTIDYQRPKIDSLLKLTPRGLLTTPKVPISIVGGVKFDYQKPFAFHVPKSDFERKEIEYHRPKINSRRSKNQSLDAHNWLSEAKNRLLEAKKQLPTVGSKSTLRYLKLNPRGLNSTISSGSRSTSRRSKSTPRGPKLILRVKKSTPRAPKSTPKDQKSTATCPKSTRRGPNFK